MTAVEIVGCLLIAFLLGVLVGGIVINEWRKERGDGD